MKTKGLEAFLGEDAIAELNHQINSPLAAIRNALYLIQSRCSDPELRRYVCLADDEVSSIAEILQAARRRSMYSSQVLGQARAAVAGRRGMV